MKVKSYKELIVWQKSVKLTIGAYRATDRYPKSELYGLVNQTRRSAASIPSNVAEGWTRRHRPEFLQSLNVALGSAAEFETQLILGNRLGFLPDDDFERISNLNEEVIKMLRSMITNLKTK